jgi:peroxiredoxin
MPTIGDPAPNFTGNDFINGGAFTLSDHAGKVIILSFVWLN